MRAELVLRIAADPNAAGILCAAECELLTEGTPPAWVFEGAARQADERVRAHLFSHPHADAILLDRLKNHVNVAARPASLSHAFDSLVPEALLVCIGDVRLEGLLASHLPPLCLACSTPRDLPVTAKVALALNAKQPLEPYAGDADVRVHLAASERELWNAN